ncbi:dihydroxyacetone kinase, phosphotransfer subunit [Natronococcus amylolyticus DSM 10524]|uniref:phosphoenolpyruvate--glycerone phosphotransferase n=1 Tax=Natronococcus amylolyticus DSM 10524 TaxID=1227497 RepID=L9X500_9EURY|nr:dihydroxyacetone kinase phosphoryl donor subunit DhaM [Natronococcus amylolyticus]ELY56785.1 dihydroxyacetone kinase, phosphotransfer subunit [Natronococcus amylolyticus DSM 10524]
MVGIVVVSHSERAAEGIREIAREMGGDVRIEAVGGTGDGQIGTTPEPIREAVEAADGSGEGVVVLVDLGSAVMNAELALEEAAVDEAVVADAPVLEGALNAAVAATAPNATVEAVREAAEEAAGVSKL